jgi:hypothetical protein
MMTSAASSVVMSAVSMWISGWPGAPYGESIPVKVVVSVFGPSGRTPVRLPGGGPAVSAAKSGTRLGRSKREIAPLSVRTVENHLQHVYEKLGISGRADLAEGMKNAY